jgi:hypothetical protein
MGLPAKVKNVHGNAGDGRLRWREGFDKANSTGRGRKTKRPYGLECPVAGSIH